MTLEPLARAGAGGSSGSGGSGDAGSAGAAGMGGSGGSAGSVGMGGSGGSAGAAGMGGSGGSAGSVGMGGSSGSGGAGGYSCVELYPGTDTCSTCLVNHCCSEVEACANETGAGATCEDSWECLVANCTDPSTFNDCSMACDDGNFNTNYNDLFQCLVDDCANDCS